MATSRAPVVGCCRAMAAKGRGFGRTSARGAGAACRVGDSIAGGEFGVATLSFVELVFEGDDAAGGVDGGAMVDQFPHPGGQAQLVPGVAAVPACGTLRGDQAGLVEA